LKRGELCGMTRKHVQKESNNNRSSFYETLKILKILKKSKISKLDDFSIWEKKILQSLRKNGISLEIKFRNFPLKVEDQKYEYIPDFLVKDFEYKDREILIEAHEKISIEDVKKYQKFRSVFGSTYYLIMIVRGEELREWNSHDMERGIFNEIWVVNDLELLIKSLLEKKKKHDDKINSFPQKAVCPAPPNGHGCGRISNGYEEIIKFFGYRGKKVQSLCRKCRTEHSTRRR
jgi:hypothetical protein